MTRHRSAVVTAASAALILFLAGLIGLSWRAWSKNAVDGVYVGWAHEPRCAGTNLHGRNRAIEWSPKLSCVITVVIRNRGPADVYIRDAVLPYVGPAAGAVIQAAPIDGRNPEPAALAIDARITLDHSITPGQTWAFRARLVFRPDGCTDKGTLYLGDWPSVNVTARGSDAQRPSHETLTVHSSHQNPGCRL